MIFTSPRPMTGLLSNPPDDVPVSEFMLDERFGRLPFAQSRPPQVCGHTGLSYTILDVKNRVNSLACSLAESLGWHPNAKSEWDKVVAIYSSNTVDYSTVCWAIHRLSGIVMPVDAKLTASELTYQLKSSHAKCIITSATQLGAATEAAAKVGISENRIFLMDVPSDIAKAEQHHLKFKSINQLIIEGANLERLEDLVWEKGQGARQTAFLCFSSGTSGIPKGTMISHSNAIAQILQVDSVERSRRGSNNTEIVLGLLPASHIYALMVINHAAVYRGDTVVNIVKYRLASLLAAIDRFKINVLYLAPPIVLAMANNLHLCATFRLSTVSTVVSGGSPLSPSISNKLIERYPHWKICELYGITETTGVLCYTDAKDVWLGSCGPLLPRVEARLVTPEGKDVDAYDQAGELLVRSPTNALGYANNKEANAQTFTGGWVKSGDVAMFRKSPLGIDHVFIVDRLKELIKVKGLQVAPAEIESHLLSHHAVADAVVVGVPDIGAGELPRAYIVKSSSASQDDAAVRREIYGYVKKHKANYKWLDGGIEFVHTIPKNASGKTLRRVLREKAKESARSPGPKL